MSHTSSDEPVRSTPSGNPDLLRWICTKNPFYAISAGLVLFGLYVSFGNQTEDGATWLLMTGLAGYTLLLALTAILLVRFLKCWDDARTVLLLVVLMFLATSVTFDRNLVIDTQRGTFCYLLGLALSILVSEAVLSGIRLRLPALYRLPYYGILALFFLYPLFLRQLLDKSNPMAEPMLWGLFGFSTAAGAVFLTLLPALRRGPDYMRDNGSPLPWPLYPWSLFGILAIAVPGRAIFMCWSFHLFSAGNFNRLIFGPYFLVPFVLALGVLLLEFALVASRKNLLRFSLAVPLLMIGLAVVGQSPADPIYRMLRVMTVSIGEFRAFDKVSMEPDPVHAEFLNVFSHRLGADPLFLTLALSAGFYGYAALRRVPLASEGFSLALAAMALLARNSLHTESWLMPTEAVLLLVPGVVQSALRFLRRNAWNHLFGAACLAAVVALAMPLPEALAEDFRPGIFGHLVMLTLLIVGAMFSNIAGKVIRFTGAMTVLLLAMAVMLEQIRIPASVLPYAPVLYPLIVGILLGIYGHFLRHSISMAVATLILGYWVFKFGWTGYRAVRGLFAGFDYITSGLGFFVVAVLVSLGKSGKLTHWMKARWGAQWWFRMLVLRQFRDVVQIPHQPVERTRCEVEP